MKPAADRPPNVVGSSRPARGSSARGMPTLPLGTLRRLLPAGIRASLLLLLLGTLVPLFAVLAGMYYARYQERRALELQGSLQMARAFAGVVDSYIGVVVRDQLAIAAVLASTQQPSEEQINSLLAGGDDGAALRPPLHWLDTQGRITTSADGKQIGLAPVDGADILAALGDREWVVTDLFVERPNGATVIAVVRGARDQQGTLRGVLVALIDPREIAAALGIPRSGPGVVAIVDPRGHIIWRYPWAEMPRQGDPAADLQPTVAATLAGEALTGTFSVAWEEQPQLGATAAIPSAGWITWAGRSEDAVMAPVNESLRRDSVLIVLVALAAFLAALAISRRLTVPVSRLQERALAIGRGELGEYAKLRGPTELEELARAFDSMTASLQAREGQHQVYVRTVSHDLRTLTAIIQGQAMVLRQTLDGAGLRGQGSRSVEAIITGTRRMRAIVQDLLDAGRLESGKPPPMTWPVDLRSFVSDLLERTPGFGSEEGVKMAIPHGLPPVEADPDYLDRILMNLLTNALKYSPNASEVVIGARQVESEIEISVADRGIGIDPEDLPHVFERFYRVDGARDDGGSGLGLSIAKALVEAQGGEIRLESEVGRGTTVAVALPAARPGRQAHDERHGRARFAR